jgi:chemotaxis protein methyltransferase CheR
MKVDMQELSPFKELIRDKCGLNFDGTREEILEKGISTRMSKKGINSPSLYYNQILNDEDEFTNLVNLLTINETYFYREQKHFDILSEHLVPELLLNKAHGSKINILSAGCSTGEEPYSIVIRLLEKFGPSIRHLISVHAADIDREAIQVAREGIYGKRSFRVLDNILMEKYFDPLDSDIYKIKDFVKEPVEFSVFNLKSDSYPDKFHVMDIIFYRNVSIYFKPEGQSMIFKKLANILNKNGYLFVSATETFFHNLDILSLIEVEDAFLYQSSPIIKIEDRRSHKKKKESIKAEPGKARRLEEAPAVFIPETAPLSEPKPSSLTEKTEEQLPERRKGRRELFDDALLLAIEKRYEESLDIIDRFIPAYPSFLKAYTLRASILINLQRMDEARKLCTETIERDRWFTEGYILLGIIAKTEDDKEEARKRFKEALYMHPSNWVPHYFLAEIFYSMGELDNAVREYGVVINLLEKGKLSEHGMTFFPVSFSEKHIMHLCRHNLNRINEKINERLN